MSQQEKRRLYIIGAILIAAVILLLLFGRKAGALSGAGNTVINQGSDFAFPGVDPVQLGDIPALDIPGQRASSRGCAVCYSGYGRIIAPSSPTPAPTIIEQNSYMLFNMASITRPSPPPPASAPRMALAFNSEPPAPRPWWENCTAGRCF